VRATATSEADDETTTSDAPPLTHLRRLHLEVTNRCNSLCETCIRTTDPDPDRDLSVPEIAAIAEQLPNLETVALQVNGDPLLHPELDAIIRLLTDRGVRVELNTNAITLHERRARTLIESGLSQLNISIDGAEASTYTLLRGVNALNKVLEHAQGFVRARGERDKPELWAWMVASRNNIAELPAVVQKVAEIGFDGFYLQRLVFYGKGLARNVDSLHGRLTDEDRDHIRKAESLARKRGLQVAASGGYGMEEMLDRPANPETARGCRRPKESAVVMANGDVVPCCISTFVAPRGEITMGNVLEASWNDVWSGDPYVSFRRGLTHERIPNSCHGGGVNWSL
jgi:MoaA/NifB/PqqE/SkfB family radical SAM enzyme